MSALLNRRFLIQNMCFMYRIMVASAPLLEFSIPLSKGRLRDYYLQHLDEEVGHEEMLLADLKALGVNEVSHFYAAAMAAGAQYYLVAHHHPALLLGYMHVLESQPLTLGAIEEIEAVHNCTLSALRHHAEHDPQHREDLAAMIESQPQELRSAIAWNEQCVKDLLQAEFQRWLDA